MSSRKKLTESQIEERLIGRPLKLVSGTFKSIREPAKWKCLSDDSHGFFESLPKQILHAGGTCPKCGKVSKLTEEIIAQKLGLRSIKLVSGTLKGSGAHAIWMCLKGKNHPDWSATPSSILNKNSGCPICSGKLPLTEDEIEFRLQSRTVSLKSKSFNHKSKKAVFLCDKDKSHPEWTSSISSVLYQQTGCPVCSGNSRLTEDDVMDKLHGRSIQLIKGSLKGANRHAEWECLKDKSHPTWKATPSGVLRGTECPACNGHEKLTPAVIKRKLKNRPVRLLSDVVDGSNYKVFWKCLTDESHENWQSTVGSVLAGSGCPECSGNSRLNEQKINARLKNRLIKIQSGTFKRTSDYATWHCQAGKNHPDWISNVSSILGGVGCPDCADYGYKENKSAYFYILYVGDLTDPIAIKCGITNNHPSKRFGQINRKTDEVMTLHKFWHHQSGKVIRDIEAAIKKNFRFKNLGKLLKDGSKETFFSEDYDNIVAFIETELSKI